MESNVKERMERQSSKTREHNIIEDMPSSKVVIDHNKVADVLSIIRDMISANPKLAPKMYYVQGDVVKPKGKSGLGTPRLFGSGYYGDKT